MIDGPVVGECWGADIYWLIDCLIDWLIDSIGLISYFSPMYYCAVLASFTHLKSVSALPSDFPSFLVTRLFFFCFFFFKKKGTNHEGKGMGSTKWIKLKHINLSLLHFLSFFVFLFLCLILFPYFLFPSIMSTSFPSSSAFYFSYITILIHLLARGFYDFFYLLVITE